MDSFGAKKKPTTPSQSDIAAVYGWLKDSITRSRFKGRADRSVCKRKTSTRPGASWTSSLIANHIRAMERGRKKVVTFAQKIKNLI